MNLFKLSASYLRFRRLSTFLNVLILALGIATIVVLLLVGNKIQENFTRNAEGIDLVVGAKGSPLQLILSALYHIDAPTGNISLEEADAIMEDPAVARAIPMALGDTYQGFRVVGTTLDYPAHFGADAEEGELWDGSLEATIGAVVARDTELEIGSTFYSAHGLSADGHAHDEHPIRVVGVLGETGTIVDRLVLTSIETVWEVHGAHGDEDHDHEGEDGDHDHEGEHDDHEDDHDHEGEHDDHEDDHDHEGEDDDHDHEGEHDDHDDEHDHEGEHQDESDDEASSDQQSRRSAAAAPNRPGQQEAPKQEYTALLIQYESPLAALAFPRYVNTETNMQAAAPAYETARLFDLLGVGFDAIRVFGFILVLVAIVSVFIALLNALKERRYDLAMMRSLGASRQKLVAHVLLEGVLLVGMGTILGLVLGHVAAVIVGGAVEQAQGLALGSFGLIPEELLIVALALGAGLVAALIPAIQAYRTDIAAVLADS